MSEINFTVTSTSYAAWRDRMNVQATKARIERAMKKAEYWIKLEGYELTDAALEIAKENSLTQVLALRLEAALMRIDELEAE